MNNPNEVKDVSNEVWQSQALDSPRIIVAIRPLPGGEVEF
jgi:hypothetical protein